MTDQSVITESCQKTFPHRCGPPMRRPAYSLVLLVTAAVGLAASIGCNREAKKPEKVAPPEVVFVTPTKESVIEYEEFTGRTAATDVVEIRARVTGYLNEVHFTDGADIKEGALLFAIDDRSFVAEEARTAAAIKQYEARADRLRRQLKRGEELFKKQAISQDEFETITFDLAEAEASISAAKAQHDIAKLNLEFTKVKAPISGRIGRRMVDEGNLVTADVTPLATIIPLQEVYVYFDMDERTVLKLRRLEDGGMTGPADESDVKIDIALADSDKFVLKGTINFLDNQIDPATGTLRVRATVENPDGLLSPGLFVRLRYPIGKPAEQWMVPEESIGSDQGQPIVYVIDKGEKEFTNPETNAKETKIVDMIYSKRVTVGPQVGKMRVIRDGLSSTAQVAVTGLQKIRAEMEVTPKPRTAESKATEEPTETLAGDKKAPAAKTAKVSVHEAAE